MWTFTQKSLNHFERKKTRDGWKKADKISALITASNITNIQQRDLGVLSVTNKQTWQKKYITIFIKFQNLSHELETEFAYLMVTVCSTTVQDTNLIIWNRKAHFKRPTSTTEKLKRTHRRVGVVKRLKLLLSSGTMNPGDKQKQEERLRNPPSLLSLFSLDQAVE